MAKARKYPKIQYDGGLCAGHLLVWTWRKLVAGYDDCPILTREYARFAGQDAEALLAAFAGFLLTLGRGSRRILMIGQPYCAGLTKDEEHMLRLIAAAQSGDSALLFAHLAWLAKREHQDGVMKAADSLAEALTEAGVMLPAVRVPIPIRPAMPELIQRH